MDSESVHYDLWREVLLPHGFELSKEAYRVHCAGIPTRGNAEYLLSQHDFGMSVSELANRKEDVTRQFVESSAYPLMPGVRDTLQWCKKNGLYTAVVTGARSWDIKASLAHHNIADLFDTVVCADEVTHGKPDPEGYLLAMDRLQVIHAQCIAVEDTPHGAEAANQAMIPCLVVPNRMSKNTDFPAATEVMKDMHAVQAWLAETLNLPADRVIEQGI